MSTQSNQQLSWYVFSYVFFERVKERLEQNIRKKHRLQKTIKYKTNEQSTKYSN